MEASVSGTKPPAEAGRARVAPGVIRGINAHGERTFPEECCGILLGVTEGKDHIILESQELDNLQDENRKRRFYITPGQYRAAEREAAARKLELLGFYHSHPDHPAIPSAFDTEHALPWFTYIIVSVRAGRAGDVTAWILSDARDHFLERHMSVSEEKGMPSAPTPN